MFADFYFGYGDEDTGKPTYPIYSQRSHSKKPSILTPVVVLLDTPEAQAERREQIAKAVSEAVYEEALRQDGTGGTGIYVIRKPKKDEYMYVADAVLAALHFGSRRKGK
jgi:hypothetical protein